MSTITTAAPSFDTPRVSGRRILVAGVVVTGLVVAGAVVIPRITATTTQAPTYPTITQHDAMEHQLDSARAAALGTAARLRSAYAEHRLDLVGKQTSAASVTHPGRTAVQQALPEGFTRVYQGGQLVAVPRSAQFGTSVARQQIGGLAPTFAWTGSRPSSLEQQQTGGHATYPYTSLHLTWADPWVPPTDNPEWVPYIKSHYFHPVSTTVRPTHEYR